MIIRDQQAKVKCYAYGMSCVGDIQFSKYAQSFCVTIMNAYDMVPTISYIAERVMLVRYLIRDYQRTGKIRA